MKIKLRAFLLMLCFVAAGFTGSVYAVPIYLDGYAAGGYYDADKSGGDDKLCWLAAASNVLAWSGWGDLNTTATFGDGNDEQVVFNYLKDHYGNVGGKADTAWNYWFSEPGLGDYSFNNYYHEIPITQAYGDLVATNLQGFINNGWGTVISLQLNYDEDPNDNYIPVIGGHALTLWGYESINQYTMDLFVTNSDRDGQAIGDWTGSDLNTYRMYKGSSLSDSYFDDIWYIAYDGLHGDHNTWMLNSVRGLEVFSDDAVPEPGTMFLLGTGLVVLSGFGRKRFKKK